MPAATVASLCRVAPYRRPESCSKLDAAPLSGRIAALKADLAAARLKESRLHHSIATRESTLDRLQTHLARHGEPGAAHLGHVH